MDIRTRIREIIITLLENIHERRKLILALSCVVVFITTYVLILPAFTLDKEEAAEQGGIDVPASEQIIDADTTSEESPSDEDLIAEESKTPSEESTIEEEDKKSQKEANPKETKEDKASSEVTLQNDESDDYSIAVEGTDAGLSEDMSIKVREIDRSSKKLKKEYDSLYSDALDAVQKEEGTDTLSDFAFAKFYDISLMDGKNEVEPDSAVDVKIAFGKDLQKELKVADPDRVYIVHFALDKDTGEIIPEVLDTDSTDITVENNKVTEAAFTTDSFSVFAVVYTVDFHYEIDGKTYDFSMDGGGCVSLAQLIQNLKISSAYTEDLLADVDSVEFSDPELIWVGRADNDTTVGDMKKANGLEPEYSANLTKEQIKKSDAQTVKAGNWALISLKPFDTEETLTVTMKNGDQFVVKITDAQISGNVLTADGKTYKITVTYDDDAEIPEGTELVAKEIKPGSKEYIQHLGKAWSEVNKDYLEQEEFIKNNRNGLDEYDEYEDIHPVNLDDARFFSISLIYNKKEIEPNAPVQIDIQYVDGLETGVAAGEAVIGAAHFIDNTENKDTEDGAVELIQAVDTVCDEDGKYVEFSYEQKGFSDIGTYVGQETTDDADASVASRIAYPKLSAMLRASSGSMKDELGEPVASKKLEDNEDGTYTLSLSVTGAAKKKDEQPKANVLFVMDRSSSMSKSENDIYLPYTGEHKDGTTYYGSNNGKNYFPLNYSNGKYTYSDNIWPYTHEYTGTVYTRISRLKAEQDAMSILFKDLLDNNKDKNGDYTKDNVEISVISFADDRGKISEGTEYPKGGSANGWTSSDYSGLMTVVNNTTTPAGTNWQDALKYAKEVADAKKEAEPNEPVFVIFLTDGEPTAVYGEHNGAHHYNNHGGGYIEAYKPARPDAKAIVDAGYEFYSIFTFNPGEEQTRYLKRLVHYAYTGYDVSDTTSGDFSYLDSSQYVNKYYYNADSPENLASAFDDILSAITTTIAHGNVSIVDGLTTDAMTSTLVNGKANGFIYKVTDENDNVLYTVTATGDTDNPSVTFKINDKTYSGSQVVQKETVDGKKYYSVTDGGKEYKMALADFVDAGEGAEEKKELKWDLSPIGTLADKCTYSIEFVVWPNQEAYDYVAALNNGLMEWNETTQTPVYDKDGELKYYKNGVKDYPSIVWDPDTKVYSVLTNTKQELEYSVVSTTNGVETIEGPYNVELDTPDPMDLKATASALEKVWNINRDPSILYKYLYESKDDQGNPVAFDIGFEIKQDEELYKEVNLPGKATVTEEGVTYDWSAYKAEDMVTYNDTTFSKRWSQDFSIATGLMLSEAQMDERSLDKSLYTDNYLVGNTRYYVLEPGHDFKISEPAVGYEFDFEEPTYHPMLVDGVLMDVKFTTEGGTKRIIGMEVLEIDTPTGKSTLSVFNTLRGYINVKKKVVDSDGTTELTTDNTEFTFEVEMTNAMPVFEGDHIPWYGINGLYYHDVDADDDYYQAEYKNGQLQVTTEEGGPYSGESVGTAFNPDNAGEQTIKYSVDGQEKIVTICGNQMTPSEGTAADGYKKVTGTAKITQTETLYIANVPVNTHYSIKETGLAALGYQLIDIERQVGTNASATVPVTTDAEINGEIVQNTETLITYTNKCQVTDINIQKTDLTGNGLEGAVFQLKTVDGLNENLATDVESIKGLGDVTKEVNGESTVFPSSFETTGDIQTISGLPDGTYRIYEVFVPEGYIKTFTYIEFKIEGRTMTDVTTDTGATSMIDTSASNIDLKIANEPGAALPNTGGPGTTLIYILGFILIGIAGTGLVISKRKKAA